MHILLEPHFEQVTILTVRENDFYVTHPQLWPVRLIKEPIVA